MKEELDQHYGEMTLEELDKPIEDRFNAETMDMVDLEWELAVQEFHDNLRQGFTKCARRLNPTKGSFGPFSG